MSEGRNTASLASSWREAMEGVTPGPWRSSRFGFQVVSDYPEPAWQSVVELTTVARSEPDAEREMLTQQALANWLARCSPSGISALLDALESTSRALSEKEGELAEARRSARNNRDGRLAEKARAETATRQRDEALTALKASEERGLVLREALLGMEHSCEQLAAIRSLDAYDAICRDSGGVQALLNLDTARRRARSALENGPATLADATKKDPGTEQREAGV